MDQNIQINIDFIDYLLNGEHFVNKLITNSLAAHYFAIN